MKQIKTFSDSRLDAYCLYCGKRPDSREHVPSKVLLDKPYPENLPIVPACKKCNQAFSLDEEYLACILECTLCGTTEPESLKRKKVTKILKRKPKLKAQIEASKRIIDNQTHFQVEPERVRNVIKKLAQGIAKFENSEIQFEEPYHLSIQPLLLMDEEQKDDFFFNRKVILLS